MPAIRPRLVATWLLGAVALGASLWFLVLRLAVPADGASVPFYADAWTASGVRVVALPGPPSGLATGDVVTSIAGRPLGSWLDAAGDPQVDRSSLAGPTVPYGVVRSGSPVEVAVTLAIHDVGGLLRDYGSAVVFTVVLQAVAWYVLWRRPESSAALALALATAGVTGSTLPWLLGLQAIDVARGWPFLLYAATAGGLYMLLWPAGLLHLPLAMTAAAPLRRRTLGLAYGIPLGGYFAALAVARIVAGSSLAWVGTWAAVQGIVIVPTIGVGIGLAVLRYRAAPEPIRRRTRWAVTGAVASALSSLVLLFVPQLLTGAPLVPWSAIGLLALPLPLGIGAAIVRGGLFDIEVVINRALVYGGLTLAIAAIYVLAVSLLGGLLGTERDLPLSLAASGIAAIAALPIRDGLQLLVNRLMYGDRDEPHRAVLRLGRRLEGTLDPRETPAVVVRTVAESLRLPWVALRIAGGEAGRTTAYGRQPTGEPITVPIVYGAEVVADLLVAPRGSAEPLSAADQKLLYDLARQVGPAIRAHALTLDLIASRERIVAAREEERRRIRRDLHDGLGPTLAAVGLRAELAADLVNREPAGAARVLDEMRGEVREAITEIRRLVDALRPPALDELGLVGALRAQAARLGPVPGIDVAADSPLPDLPAAVEVAAYRIAVEAMTNAARHSGGTACWVRLRDLAADGAGSGEPADGRLLEVEVVDDGRGLPDRVRPGIGLASMRERAAEVGGECIVRAGQAGGTIVRARLPLGDSAEAAGDG